MDALRLFVSYARSDGSQFVTELKSRLATAPVSVTLWIDTDELVERVEEDIRRQLCSSDAVLFVLSNDLDRSIWTRWERAVTLDRELPMLVLQVHRTDQLVGLTEPLRFDFTPGAAPEWDALLRHLRWLGSADYLVEAYTKRLDRMAALVARATGSTRRRYTHELGFLRERLAEQRTRQRDPDAAERTVATAVAAARRSELAEPPAVPEDQLVRCRYVPPPVPPSGLLDRVHETRELLAVLNHPTTRVVVLHGEDGIGKTAMAAQLLAKARTAPQELPLRGFAYLPAHGHRPITAGTTLHAMVDFIDDRGLAERAEKAIEDASVPWPAKLNTVLEGLARRRALLVIDSAEALLDRSGRVVDERLRGLLEALLGRDDHAVQVVLMTAQQRVALLRHAGVGRWTIGGGLPKGESWRLLRELDTENLLELDRYGDDLLDDVFAVTRGYPRVLELMVSVLYGEQHLTLDRLLAELRQQTAPEKVMECLLDRTLDQLDRERRRVVEAVAIFGRPVGTAAVDFLLQRYAAGCRSPAVLAELADRRLLRRDGQRYYLPRTPDRQRVLDRIPCDDPDAAEPHGAPTQVDMFRQAADFYADVPTGNAERIDQLSPRFHEIEMRICGREHLRALHLMDALDSEFLIRWNQSGALTPWRRQLERTMPTPHLKVHNLSRKVLAALQDDDPIEAIRVARHALRLARRERLGYQALVLTLQLAEAHWVNGEVNRAWAHFIRAIPETEHFARRHADSAGRYLALAATATLGVARCELETADYAVSEQHHAQALDLAARAGEQEGGRTARILLSLGTLHGMLGRPYEAFRIFRQGMRLLSEREDAVLFGYFLGAQAMVRMDIGELDVAHELAERAYDNGTRMNDRHMVREAATTLARIHLCRGDVPLARRAADEAVTVSSGRHRSFGALTLQGVTAVRAGDTRHAQPAFTAACREMENLLHRDGNNVELLDYAGLAASGLAVCDDDEAALRQAVKHYRSARELNPQEHVVRRSTRLLVQLMKDQPPPWLNKVLRAAAGPFFDGI